MNGLLYDLGPHLIDQAIQLFGSPAAVFAQVRRLRPGTPGDDFIRLQLGYADGLWAELAIDQLNPFPTPRFQLRGTDGSFEKYGLDPQEEALCRGDFPGCPGWGEEPPEAWGTLWTPNGSHRIRTAPGDYSHFYRGVYRAIVAGAEPPVSLGDVRVQMQIISLALHSSERGTLERLDSPRSDSPSLSAGLACAK